MNPIRAAVAALFLGLLPGFAFGQEDVPASVASEAITANEAHEQARAAMDAGNYANALESISIAQRQEPDNGLFIWTRVQILESMGEVDLAYNVLMQQRDKILTAVDPIAVEAAEARLVGTADEASEPDDAEETISVETLHDPSPVAGYLLTGAGITFVATSATLFLVGQSDKVRLDCSTGERSECGGVAAIQGLTDDEAKRRRKRISTLRNAGWVSAGVGLGLVGFGIWELLQYRWESQTRATITPTLGEHTVGVVIQWRR